MLDVRLCVRVKWLQLSCCVTESTVCPYVLHPLISITPANQAHINQQRCQEAWGRESVHPRPLHSQTHTHLSVTLDVNCRPASHVDYYLFDLIFIIILAGRSKTFCTDGLSTFVFITGRWAGSIASLSFSLSVFFLSLSRPGKVENWLQVIWRRSYLLLTVEWHHNGAAGVQLPFSPPPSVLPSASTPALADKLRLMTQISREPVYLPISHARALVWETLLATARCQCMWISLTCSPDDILFTTLSIIRQVWLNIKCNGTIKGVHTHFSFKQVPNY